MPNKILETWFLFLFTNRNLFCFLINMLPFLVISLSIVRVLAVRRVSTQQQIFVESTFNTKRVGTGRPERWPDSLREDVWLSTNVVSPQLSSHFTSLHSPACPFDIIHHYQNQSSPFLLLHKEGSAKGRTGPVL
jgi:hypothetical protein